MFYELYDTIEESSVEEVLRKFSLHRRNEMLSNTPAEELIMYSIIGLTSEELKELFSKSVLEKEFSRLPPTDLFYSFDLIQEVYKKGEFRRLFRELSTEDFLKEYKKTPWLLFNMIDSGLIGIEDVVAKIESLTIQEISNLKRYHAKFQYVWVGLETLIQHCIFPILRGTSYKGESNKNILVSAKRAYSRDLVKLVISFI